MKVSEPLRLVLASASPARLRLLRAAGLDPVVRPSGADEDVPTGTGASEAVAMLAERKTTAVAGDEPESLVLGCDSLFAFGELTMGKPATADEAVSRWYAMRGGQGLLHTGHCLIDTSTGDRTAAVATTVVRFGHPSDYEIERYVETGEPLAVAGGCTLDGFSAPFIDGVDGDPGNVIGVSLPLLRRLLGDLGVEITSLWRPSR